MALAATKVGSAYIELTAKTDKYKRGMAEAQDHTRRVGANIRNEMGKTDDKIRGMTGSMGMFRNAMIAIGGVAATGQLVKIADSFTQMRNKLNLVVKEGESLADVEERLYQLAIRNRAALEPTVALYARLRSARTDLSDEQAQKIVDTWNKTLVISGATAGGAAAATIQFSQAMAGGVLRAEEFNSIVENNIRAVQLFASSLGVTMGELRTLVNDGKVQFDDLVKALTADAGAVGDEFGSMSMTVSQALTNLETATIRFVGALDELTGGSQGLANLIAMLAEAIETFTVFAKGSTPAIEKMKAQTAQLADAIAATDEAVAKGGLKDLGDDATKALQPLTAVEQKIADINKRLEETGGRSRINAISRIEGGMIMQLAEIGELENELNNLQSRRTTRDGMATPYTVGSASQIAATQKALDDARKAYGDALIRLDELQNTPDSAFKATPKATTAAAALKKDVSELTGYMTELERLESSLADIRKAQGEGATNAGRASLQVMLDYLEATGDVATVLDKMKGLAGNILDPSDVSRIEMFAAAVRASQFGSQASEINKLGLNGADILPDVFEATPTAWDGFEYRIAEATKYGLMNAIETGDWGDAFGQILTDVTRDALNNALDVLWEALAQIDWGGQGKGWAGFVDMVGGSFAGNRASGGDVSAGRMYRVGEKGSEWFMPNVDGQIIPNDFKGKSLGSQSIMVGAPVVNVYGNADSVTRAEIAETLGAFSRGLPAVIDQRVTDRQKRGAY